MILKNFDVYKKLYLSAPNYSTAVIVPNIKTTDNYEVLKLYTSITDLSIGFLAAVDNNKSYNAVDFTTDIWAGTGTNAVTYEDYAITPIDNASVTKTSFNCVRSINNDGTISLTYTRQFTALADLTITEVGLSKGLNAIVSNSTTAKRFLLARELLPTPITVSAGDSFTVSMVITI